MLFAGIWALDTRHGLLRSVFSLGQSGYEYGPILRRAEKFQLLS